MNRLRYMFFGVIGFGCIQNLMCMQDFSSRFTTASCTMKKTIPPILDQDIVVENWQGSFPVAVRGLSRAVKSKPEAFLQYIYHNECVILNTPCNIYEYTYDLGIFEGNNFLYVGTVKEPGRYVFVKGVNEKKQMTYLNLVASLRYYTHHKDHQGLLVADFFRYTQSSDYVTVIKDASYCSNCLEQ